MLRPSLLALGLATLGLAAPAAAQSLRHDARPAAGTLQARPDRPTALLDLRARVVSENDVPDCAGQVDPSAPDAVVEWRGGGPLRVDARTGFDSLLLVRGPDGRWHCNDDTDGLMPAVEIEPAPRGRYAVWVGAFSTEHAGEAVTLRAGRPAPPAAPDASARPGATLAARGGFEGESGPLTATVRAGGLDAVGAMPLGDDLFCSGFVDASAPTAVVRYTPGGPGTLAMTAETADETDLVLLVRTPSGAWLCNDDFAGMNPVVSAPAAAPGDYAVWVGTFRATPRGAAATATLRVTEALPEAPEFDFGDEEPFVSTPFSEGTYDPAMPALDGTIRLDPAAAPQTRLALAADADRAEAAATVRAEGFTPVQGDRCVGRLAPAPTAALTLAGDGPFVVTAAPPEDDFSDLVIAVRTPAGQWFCSDDAEGLNPGVQLETAEAGTYLVWAGPLGEPESGQNALVVAAYRGALPEPDFGEFDDGPMGPPEPVYSPGTYAGTVLDTAPSSAPVDFRGLSMSHEVQIRAVRIANPVEGDFCRGFVTAAPSLALRAPGGQPLTIEARPYAGESDLTLTVRTPDGQWVCSDDADGAVPILRVDDAVDGVYGVWVGTYAEDAPEGGVTVTVQR